MLDLDKMYHLITPWLKEFNFTTDEIKEELDNSTPDGIEDIEVQLGKMINLLETEKFVVYRGHFCSTRQENEFEICEIYATSDAMIAWKASVNFENTIRKEIIEHGSSDEHGGIVVVLTKNESKLTFMTDCEDVFQ